MKIAGVCVLILASWLRGASHARAGDEHAKGIANLFAQLDRACNDPDSANHWRQPRMCGSIALCTYLRLHGRQCAFSDVSRSVAIDRDRGTSFLDLQLSAARFGVESQIIRIPDGNLASVPLPAIAHMSVPSEGHYIVLLKVTEHQILVADPMAGMVKTRGLDEFRRNWSGVLMVNKSKVVYATLIEVCTRAGFFGVGCMAFLAWRKARDCRLVKRGSCAAIDGEN